MLDLKVEMKKRACSACKQEYWASENDPPDAKCSTCTRSLPAPIRPAVPTVVTSPPHYQLLRSGDLGVTDLRQVIQRAAEPVVPRQRTFMEWLTNADTQEIDLAKKARVSTVALQMLQQRTKMVQDMRALVLATRELEDVEIESEMRRRQVEIAFMKLEANRLEIEEELERHRVLREVRLETLRLKEQQAQARIRESMNPPTGEVDGERARRRNEAAKQQAVIADFMDEVTAAFAMEVSDAEKAMRIRTILKVYDYEVADLPREIADFMTSMEGGDRV